MKGQWTSSRDEKCLYLISKLDELAPNPTITSRESIVNKIKLIKSFLLLAMKIDCKSI